MINVQQFLQRHYEAWAATFPGSNINQLTAEQKQTICERINREFSLSEPESQSLRAALLNSADSAPLILPFMDHKLETLMIAANVIAAGG